MATKETTALVKDDRFTFAQQGDVIHDQKLDTKPRGYFKDAFIRFTKNRASVVASILIGIIILFAIIVPLATPGNIRTLFVPQYAKLGPRNTVLYNIGVNGGKSASYDDRNMVYYASLGVAAEFSEDTPVVSIEKGNESYYSAVIGYSTRKAQNKNKNVYDANIDQYLAVGFKNIQIEQKDFQIIKDYEKEHGFKILYPLIDTDSEYYPSTFKNSADEANYWYKTVGKADPINASGSVVGYSTSLVLEHNYLLDADNNFVYSTAAGGGDASSHQLKVRVLFYNYYRYLYGREPNYLFGTDSQGYSMIYRLSSGIRLSLVIAVLVSVINFILGAIYGAIEGYYGGTTDLVMERISDILSQVPFVVVVTLFQLHLAKIVGSFVCLLFAYISTGWIGTASGVRTQFYRYKNQEYVLAARTLGASNSRIMWKHIFPNTLGTIITSSALVIPGVVYSESMLSYLGIIQLGGADATSLGTLLSDASSIWIDYPSTLVFPAVVLSLLMICFNLFGNGLRDAFNPQLRGSDE